MTKKQLFNLRKMRVNAGLTHQELANLADVSLRTVYYHQSNQPSKLEQLGYKKLFENIKK